jgi:hypothetical protein
VTALSEPVRFGIAYFGVRDLDHARFDLAEIAEQGFSWVLLPFTHDDALWEAETFRDLVTSATSLGMDAVISPWGGAAFGGEGVQTDLPINEWIARARATGAAYLHVDEPRISVATMAEVLEMWADDSTAWLTMQPERASELAPGVVHRVGALGTDAYDGTTEERVRATQAFAAATGRLDLAWVRAFRVASGEEPLVGDATRAMAGLAPMVGVWGWKGSTGRGTLRSANPDLVQGCVAEAIAELTLTAAA